jgi:Transposase IS66 family
VLSSKVVGTDDTPVKVLDRNLPQTRKGRIWPYVGDRDHPAIVYDYTPTRERAGPEEFLKDFRGHLQADAYVVYDSFFTDPARGMVEVGAGASAPNPQCSSLNDLNGLADVDQQRWLEVARPKRETGHLAFHAAGVSPVAARHNTFLEDFLQDGFMKGFPLARGE